MKKILLLIVAVLFATSLFAENVNQNKAKQVAKAFAAQRDRNAAQLKTDIVYSHPMPNKRDAAFYVVNLGDTGFVIVSANDVAHPVIGYSFDSPWPTEGNIPPQITDYLDDLAGQIEAASQNQPDQATKTEWQELLSINPNNPPQPKGNRTEVGPLLTTTWDQGQYYNAMCPEDANGPDGHVVTGCVATAMAQIINYHEYPASGRGTHSYDSNYGTLSVNFAESNYDYANMPDALTNESSEAQVNAVAKLMSDCGIAVNMGYTSGESGAYDQEARAALINFFKYSPDMSFAEKAFFSANEWNTMLQTELNANRPVYYSGRGTGGHAFVCDGYNNDGYYHFNFGWSGSGNTWYLLDAVEPLGMNFNSSQSAILGIAPDANGNVILGQMQGTSTFMVDEPLEFYHLMGHNQYEGNNYTNPCNNTVSFVSADDDNQLVADIMEFEDQNLLVYNGNTTNVLLRELHGGGGNDLSPVVSTANAVTINYSGNLFYAGFKLSISQNSDCRMVSNILASVDITTVHLAWTENGSATQWQIEYGEEGFSHGEGTSITANTTTKDVVLPQMLTKYDIYIRSICDENSYGLWAKTTVFSEAPYWQDIVISQPANYTIDETTNCAIISCAEDFVWFIKTYNNNINKAIFVSDIDLGGYKWKPVNYDTWEVYIDGDGHIINNLYIVEKNDYTALFSHLKGEMKNLGIEHAYIKGGSSATAGFCGELNGNAVMFNCHIAYSKIEGNDHVGGIAAMHFGTIKNCYADVDISANRWTGLMTGYSGGVIMNSYATGTIQLRSYCYSAGIAAYAPNGTIKNCYSVDLPMGVVGYKGETIISDTSSFYKNGSAWTLRTPIGFEDGEENGLLEAMNKGVIQFNDNNLRTWVTNDITYLPEFGDFYVVHCPNIMNLEISNALNGNESCVVLDWEEPGDSQNWNIKYRRVDAPNNTAVVISVDNKPAILPVSLYNISLGYEYEFSVRNVCDESNHSGWISKNEMIDLPFWTDVVTVCPEGYTEDINGNVSISSAEGLAWIAVLVNGLHGNTARTFEGKIITLTSDIDLQGYRWYPIGREGSNYNFYHRPFKGVFNGNGFVISNLYSNCSGRHVGLFGFAVGASFLNVTLNNGAVRSYYGERLDVGGLLGEGREIIEITNCHSRVSAEGIENVGSLCGHIFDNEGNESTVISNCSASGCVYGRTSCGGLIGDARGAIVQNSFATGNVNILEGNSNSWYRGGLIGNCMSRSIIRNCYSTGNVEIDNYSSWCGIVIGSPYSNSHTQYAYGLLNNQMNITGQTGDIVTDTSSFYNNNGQQILVTPIIMDGSTYNNLLAVLNAWVAKINDPMLKTWIADSLNENGGYPVFGDNYEPSCYNPTNVTITNATVVGDDTVRTQIAWEQEGNPASWELLYVAAQQSIDQGTIIPVTSNLCVLTSLPVGEVLDIYVRAICSTEERSGWSQYARYIPEKLRWTDVVTSQPDGYYKDNDGNVYISSAEGIAWLSSVVNELNGNHGSTSITNIYLISDIDLSAYRWTAIKTLTGFVFEGNGHTINGLYCNEYANHQGLFEDINDCTIRNLKITNSTIYGLVGNGTIAGEAGGLIENCIVNGEISGVMWTGGLVGRSNGRVLNVYNSAYIGEASSRSDITLPEYYNGFVGGITGEQYGATLQNIYVAAEIPTSDYSGIVAGSGNGSFSNLYAKNYPTELHITYPDLETNSSFFSGSGSTWTLNTPPYVNGAFRTDLLDALNAWVDANNTNGEYLYWVADTENQNGGFPMLERLPNAEYQIQQLASGWNWYSTYIEQNDADGLSMLESGLGSHGELIMSRTGAMVENFEGSFWWGDLNAVTNEEMYEIKTNAQTNVVMTGGKATPSSHPITVAPGWNWIGYVSNTSNSIDNALSSLASNEDDIIQSRNAFSSYFPGYGWYGDLENMTPGQGYMYKSNGTVSQTLVYPTASRSNESEAVAYHNQADYNRYRNVMDVMAKVIINGEPANSNRYELAAFVDGECRGRAKLQYVEPIETYLAFITINGNEGEEIAFRLYDEDRVETYEADDSNIVLFKPNEVIGRFRAPYIVRFSNAETEETSMFTIYPNPVDKDTEFTIDIPTNERISEVIITNSVGSIIRNERMSQGNTIQGLPQSGVYNIQIITEQGNNYRGRVIVK